MTDKRNKNDPIKDHPKIIQIKNEARRLREEQPGLGRSHALEVLARSKGFSSYAAFRADIKSIEGKADV